MNQMHAVFAGYSVVLYSMSEVKHSSPECLCSFARATSAVNAPYHDQ